MNQSSPFIVNDVKKGVDNGDKDYVSFKFEESVRDGFDSKRPTEFIIDRKLVEKERRPIQEWINSFRDRCGLKTLLKGIVTKQQMDELICNTGAKPITLDTTKLPTNDLELEKMVASIDETWRSIPQELKGDLTKEEFLSSLTASKLQNYILKTAKAKADAAKAKAAGSSKKDEVK